MARIGRDARLGGPPDPRRRHSDPGAQARAVRAGDGLGAEGARHDGGGRRPADADRADRRAGPDGARRFALPAGRRSGAGVGAQVAAVRSRRRRPDGAGARPQGLAVGRSCWPRAADNGPLARGGHDAGALARARPNACRRSSSTPACWTATACARACCTRLGPEAADAIDEFLNLALAYDDERAADAAGLPRPRCARASARSSATWSRAATRCA